MFLLSLIVILGSFLYFNLRVKETKKEIDATNYLVIGKENVFAVYDEKLALKIPSKLNVSKDEKIKDFLKVKNYDETVAALNEILPKKLEDYYVMKRGKVEIEVANMKNIPEVTIGENTFVLTSEVDSIFSSIFEEKKEVNLSSFIIDVLNGNGIGGYAGKTGKKIENRMGMKYNAANHEKETEYSYIITKDLPKDKAEELVMSLSEKYIKVKKDNDIPTLANAVIILGKEKEINDNITLFKNNGGKSEFEKTLINSGYKNVATKKSKVNIQDEFIEYNEEDYYIAYKLAEKLGIKKMLESEKLKNNINVYVNK